jgi:hypothetical protein
MTSFDTKFSWWRARLSAAERPTKALRKRVVADVGGGDSGTLAKPNPVCRRRTSKPSAFLITFSLQPIVFSRTALMPSQSLFGIWSRSYNVSLCPTLPRKVKVCRSKQRRPSATSLQFLRGTGLGCSQASDYRSILTIPDLDAKFSSFYKVVFPRRHRRIGAALTRDIYARYRRKADACASGAKH